MSAGRLLLHVVVKSAQGTLTRADFYEHHIIIGSDPTRADLLPAPPDTDNAPDADNAAGAGNAETLAGEHALLEQDGERVYVHALEGATVHVNGKPVERAQVTPNDDVRLGPHHLRCGLVHPATARRWSSTSQEGWDFPPAENAAPEPKLTDKAAISHEPAAPAWLLPKAPEPTRRALLHALPKAATAVLQPDAAARAGRGLALIKLGTDVQDHRLVRRSYSIPKSTQTVGRYARRTPLPSPLTLRRTGRRTAAARIPAGVAWVVITPEGPYDEQAGIRQNRVRRQGNHVRLALTEDDELRVHVPPTTWVARMVPLPEPPARTQLNLRFVPWRQWLLRARALALSALILTMLLAATAFAWRTAARTPAPRRRLAAPARHAPAVLEARFLDDAPAPRGAALASASSQFPWPAGSPKRPGYIGVPGGSHGYRLFGMILPEAVTTPDQLPGKTRQVPADRAWLRGQPTPWSDVLKAAIGGPPWLLDSAAEDIQVSDPKLQPAEIGRWLRSHPDPWSNCYEKTKPPKKQTSLGATLVVTAKGQVRSIRPWFTPKTADATAHADKWVRCLTSNKGALHTPKFKGKDVTIHAVVTLWPWTD